MALLRKQADLIERGFYILEEPSLVSKRYLVGPLNMEGTSDSTIYGQFKSFDLSEGQKIAAPVLVLDEAELRSFLVTQSHVGELLTLAPQKAEKDMYFDLFSDLQMQFKRGELLKAVPYICLKQELGSFPSLDEFAFLALTGLGNKKSGYLFGFYDPKSKKALLGCSPEFIFKTTESSELITTAVAGTKKTSSGNVWTEKLKTEHKMVMDGVSQSLNNQVRWGEVNEITYGELSHLRAEGLIHKNIDIKTVSAVIHPTPAIGGLPKEMVATLKLGPEPRGYFGGYVETLQYERPFSLVTIRCFEWNNSQVQVCIGGGVLKESLAEEEWAELEDKWTTFKKIWEI